MRDLINKKALFKALEEELEDYGKNMVAPSFWTAVRVIDDLPTVEAKEVVHAKWEECAWVEFDGIHCGVYTYPNGGLACSNCHHAFKKELLCPDNFCPNCGADMRTSAK